MNRKYFSWMALIVITLLLTLTQSAFSVAPPTRLLTINSFNINNNAECTYRHTVILNSVAQGGPTEYRASEQQNFSGASWISPYSASVEFNLSPGLGTKTVYFQLRNRGGVSNVIKDSIVVKQRPKFETGRPECDQTGVQTTPGAGAPVVPPDPSIEALNITINRIYDPYKLDINFEIQVKKVPGAENLRIELKAGTSESRLTPETQFVSVLLNYNAGIVSGDYIRNNGLLVITIPYDRLVFVSAPQGRSTNFFVTAEIKLPSGYTDSNLNNNTKAKMVTLRSHSVTLSHNINACMGATGDSGNWGFNLSSQVPEMAWVGQSKLDLLDCPDLKCDRLPLVPIFGERVIRWEKRPSTADKSGTVHWTCEGDANVMQGGQPLFRFTVKTDVIEPSVAP